MGRGKVTPWLHVVKADHKRKRDNARNRICKHMRKHLSWNSPKCQFRRSVQTASAKTTPEWENMYLVKLKVHRVKTKTNNKTKAKEKNKQTKPHTQSKSSSYKQICCWKLSAQPFWAEYFSFCWCPGQIARCSLSLTAVLTAELRSRWSEQGCCVEFAQQI